ncbi:MAG: hypothetical protein IT173_02210 [Acidobacteria bacterium]|nr:hypothetical protein [Acidobacteriota bacterium]
MIREFVAAFLLCGLCGAFAFFAFTILFGNAKVANRNLAKAAEVYISNFKFQI